MRVLRVCATALILFFAADSMALAAPWAEPGNARLRSDIETLKKFGLISGPVTTWPIPWKQITAQLDRDIGRPLPAYVRQALARVRDHAPTQENFEGLNYSAAAQATNKSSLVRTFGDAARDTVDAQVSAEGYWASTAARVTVGFRNGDRNGKLTLDGSYLAQSLGNWAVYGGWVDRWWGPGRESALMFSTNPRPLPTIGLMRLEPKPFGTKFLSWLGPWQVNMTLSRQENDRRDFAHPLIVGLRASFTPIKNLDVGFSRLFQMCGRGRPCGFSVWRKSFLPFGRVLNRPGEGDPGNQQASFDASYTFGLPHDASMNMYLEMNGEDGATVYAQKYARLIGASATGPWGGDGAQWRLTAEVSDTYITQQSWGEYREPNVFYNHGVYTDGTRYLGRALGASLDSDSLLKTIDGSVTDVDGRVYTVKYHHAEINRIRPLPQYNPISGTAETINIIEAGVKLPTDLGVIDMDLRYQTDSLNTPNRKVGSAQAEVRWSKAF